MVIARYGQRDTEGKCAQQCVSVGSCLPYRPSEVSQDDIVERMVRDYIRIGVSEETARKQVAALLQASKSE
jgi:hypothetical protein